MNTTDLTPLSDEWLEWALAHGGPGEKNSAPYFQQLPTIEHRVRARRDAMYTMNCAGGNYSGAVSCAVAAMLRNGLDAPTSAEAYAERLRKERGR
jgi:hypothetical protein